VLAVEGLLVVFALSQIRLNCDRLLLFLLREGDWWFSGHKVGLVVDHIVLLQLYRYVYLLGRGVTASRAPESVALLARMNMPMILTV